MLKRQFWRPLPCNPQHYTCTTYPATRNYTLHTSHYRLLKGLFAEAGAVESKFVEIIGDFPPKE